MILSSITVCLVPEASGGPFVYHGDLPAACREASVLGFDAIEIFAPSGRHVDRAHLQELLGCHRLQLAAVGTGAGMLLHNHSLSDPDSGNREQACTYVREIIDFGADFGAPAIVGSMQGQTHGKPFARVGSGGPGGFDPRARRSRGRTGNGTPDGTVEPVRDRPGQDPCPTVCSS